MDDDDIVVSIRLDDDVALKLAMFAHEARITMNELVVQIIAESVYAWRVTSSRNRREGRYVGRFNGRSIRTTLPQFQIGRPDRGVARAVHLNRLKMRVARYQWAAR